jgi:hypothetical protein
VKEKERIEASLSLAGNTGNSSYLPPAASGSAHADSLDVGEVKRRELLKIMGGMALSAPLVGGVDADALRRELDSAINAPTTKSDVDEWERVAAQYSVESGVIPPALLLPELLTDLGEAQLRLKGSPESLRGSMARICGYLSALAASNFFNTGNEMAARRYWRTALRIIGQADDRPAQAQLYAFRAECTPSPEAKLALAEDAISIAGEIPCVGAAKGYASRASSLALLGNHQESKRALQDLTDTFARIPDAALSNRADGGFSEQVLHFTEGQVHAYAGRVPDAVKAIDVGRSMVPDGHWIAVTCFEASRATCLIRSGDPSEGARHVVRTIQALPSGFRQATNVRIVAARALDAVPDGSTKAPAVTEARELLSLPPGGRPTG